MAHKKLNLPTKTCQFCQRPFAWRKKWQRDWQEVRYCSKSCSAQARAVSRQNKAS